MGAPSPPSLSSVNTAGNQLAQTQQGYNIGAQAGSQYNQSNPYGSLSYSQTGTGPGGVPIYSATENLSPQQQSLYNLLVGSQTSAGQQGQNLITGANYGSVSPTQAIGNMTSGTTGQILGAETNYLQPFFNMQSQQANTQLQNEGFTPGTQGYTNAMLPITTGQDLTVSNFLANAEPQAFNQAQTLYQEPATLGSQLAQFGAPTSPNSMFTTQTPALQPTNAIGATQAETNAALGAYNAQYQQYANMMNGLFGIGSGVLGGLSQSGQLPIGLMFGAA